VKDLEQDSFRNAFDRDTKSEYVAYGKSQVEAVLESATEVHSIKVYGPSAYKISAEVKSGGVWVSLGSLTQIDLNSQGAGCRPWIQAPAWWQAPSA